MCAPNLNLIAQSWWGNAYESCFMPGIIGSAANMVVGSNPPFGPADLANFYPKFTGAPATLALTITAGETDCTLANANSSLQPGMLISGTGIPAGTTIASVSATDLELSQAATVNGTAATVYLTPLVPAVVINQFCALASACLNQARWLESWSFGMALFVAHYCTLWLQSEGLPGSIAAQTALAGLAKGVAISQSAGDVSVSYQPVTQGFESWGAWQSTTYGVQLITIAKRVGRGIMVIY